VPCAVWVWHCGMAAWHVHVAHVSLRDVGVWVMCLRLMSLSLCYVFVVVCGGGGGSRQAAQHT
jgi:hypothetical protein